MEIPDGFTEFTGSECPLGPTEYAEMLILTSEGLGSTGVALVTRHVWHRDVGNEKYGDMIAYRPAEKGDDSHFHNRERLPVSITVSQRAKKHEVARREKASAR